MGWQIAQKGSKYRIWSTNSDSWLTGWIDRNEVIRFYYRDALADFKKRVVEQYFRFPHHWSNRDRKLVHNDEGNEAYCEWMRELISKSTEGEYDTFIDEAFDKVMKELELEEKTK